MAASSRLPQSRYVLSLLRIVTGFLFSLHGVQLVFGRFGGVGHGASAALFSLTWFAGLLELVGGPLIAVGIFTRPTAFLLCGEMAVAYFKAHAPRGRWPISNGGELAVLYCFLFLYICVAGGGPISLDKLIRGRE